MSAGAYQGFLGRIGRTVAGSEPSWPPRPSPPEGAPNVVVILCDDLGYSDVGCFGSEIPTPNVDRLAREGVRYTNFHVTPQCSPTRASLLTGLNPHQAGFGTTAQIDPGFPGYAMELPADSVTLAEVLRDNGYATLAVGKWHLCKQADLSEAGSKHSWPLQRGFDRFYGNLEPFTHYHHPHCLIEDNHSVSGDRYPDDYYYTDDLTDRAIAMVREAKTAAKDKPVFLYFAHGAVHGPLQARAEDIAKFHGAYNKGWD
ncbi:MAG: sulfatase-like hydrolase/transferase, partial [Actinomycetota bacterium]